MDPEAEREGHKATRQRLQLVEEKLVDTGHQLRLGGLVTILVGMDGVSPPTI